MLCVSVGMQMHLPLLTLAGLHGGGTGMVVRLLRAAPACLLPPTPTDTHPCISILRPAQLLPIFPACKLCNIPLHTSRCVLLPAPQAYKYVPFGAVDEVLPYLVRRAQENSDMLGGVGVEMGMLRAELKRRLLGGK